MYPRPWELLLLLRVSLSPSTASAFAGPASAAFGPSTAGRDRHRPRCHHRCRNSVSRPPELRVHRRLRRRTAEIRARAGRSEPDVFDGVPSNPGLKPGQLETLSEWATSVSPNRPVVTEYFPSAAWLWTNWQDTALLLAWPSVAISVGLGLCVDLYAHHEYEMYMIASGSGSVSVTNSLTGTTMGVSAVERFSTSIADIVAGILPDDPNLTWDPFQLPPDNIPIIGRLKAFTKLWEYQLSLCTLTIAFFLGQSYDHWKSVYFCSRAIQGRINDICLLVTLGAARTNGYGDADGITGYARGGGECEANTAELVKDVTRHARLSHTFFWAATPANSDGLGDNLFEDGGPLFGPKLMSPEGLEGLVRVGQLTPNEKDALIATGLPPSQYSTVLLEWIGIRVMDGIRKGELIGGSGLENNILKNIVDLRAQYFSIGDYNAGRMPMAYIQLVQILVDTLVFLAPFALYPELGTVSILLGGLLAFFFKGILELSKSFLDPFGVDGYTTHNIRVDVLVSEVNFGAAYRWVDAGDCYPSELRRTGRGTNESNR